MHSIFIYKVVMFHHYTIYVINKQYSIFIFYNLLDLRLPQDKEVAVDGLMSILTEAVVGGIKEKRITVVAAAVIIKTRVLLMIEIEIGEIGEKKEFAWSIINDIDLFRLRRNIFWE